MIVVSVSRAARLKKALRRKPCRGKARGPRWLTQHQTPGIHPHPNPQPHLLKLTSFLLLKSHVCFKRNLF